MNHLLAFVLCLAGYIALAFAMRRQQRDIIGSPCDRPLHTFFALPVPAPCCLRSAFLSRRKAGALAS